MKPMHIVRFIFCLGLLFVFSAQHVFALTCDEEAKQAIPSGTPYHVKCDSVCKDPFHLINVNTSDCVGVTPSCCVTVDEVLTCADAAKTVISGGQKVDVQCTAAVDCQKPWRALNTKTTDCTAQTPVCCVKPSDQDFSVPGTVAGSNVGNKTSNSPGSSITLTNPLGAGTTLFTLINRVVKTFLGMVGAFALAVFVFAGMTWMTAGSSDRINQARDAMKYAILGLALIAFSYTITNFLLKAVTQGASTTAPASQPSAAQPIELSQ